MAIMGFATKQEELLNTPNMIKEVYKTLDDSVKEQIKQLETHIWWCVEMVHVLFSV